MRLTIAQEREVLEEATREKEKHLRIEGKKYRIGEFLLSMVYANELVPNENLTKALERFKNNEGEHSQLIAFKFKTNWQRGKVHNAKIASGIIYTMLNSDSIGEVVFCSSSPCHEELKNGLSVISYANGHNPTVFAESIDGKQRIYYDIAGYCNDEFPLVLSGNPNSYVRLYTNRLRFSELPTDIQDKILNYQVITTIYTNLPTTHDKAMLFYDKNRGQVPVDEYHKLKAFYMNAEDDMSLTKILEDVAESNKALFNGNASVAEKTIALAASEWYKCKAANDFSDRCIFERRTGGISTLLSPFFDYYCSETISNSEMERLKKTLNAAMEGAKKWFNAGSGKECAGLKKLVRNKNSERFTVDAKGVAIAQLFYLLMACDSTDRELIGSRRKLLSANPSTAKTVVEKFGRNYIESTRELRGMGMDAPAIVARKIVDFMEAMDSALGYQQTGVEKHRFYTKMEISHMLKEQNSTDVFTGEPIGEGETVDGHHIKPIEYGGNTSKDNLAVLGKKSHIEYHSLYESLSEGGRQRLMDDMRINKMKLAAGQMADDLRNNKNKYKSL